MSRELVKPAPVVLITGADPYKLAALVAREKARRALVVRVPVQEIQPGLWAAEVTMLKPIRPAWVKPAAIACGSAGFLALLAWLGWLAVTAVASAVAAIPVAALVGIAVVTGLVLRATRSSSTTVDVRVRVRR